MGVTAIIPQLRTTDLDRSIAFYTDTLGLTLAMRYGDFYAGIEAGGQSFHLKLVDTPDPSIPFVAEGEHFHLYLAVDDLAGFADRLERGGIALVQPIREQLWGMRELAFQDDSGHTIYAGERIAP